jgi:hypothetical protein
MADTLKILKCPACGKEMEKVYIPSQGINLDVCTNGCGGIYFDNREFKYFDEQNEDISIILEKLKDKTFTKVSDKDTRFCPNCGAKMIKNHSSIKQTIEVDDCYTCGGKFLDNGELVKIRQEYENNNERDKDILDFVYQSIGDEIKKQDELHEKYAKNRTPLQKLFYKLTEK